MVAQIDIVVEKPLDMTKAEEILYADQLRKFRKKEWDLANCDKVAAYRRATTLRRCVQRCSVPTKETVRKYKFTKDELKPIFDALWSKWSTVEELTDKEDSSSGDNE